MALCFRHGPRARGPRPWYDNALRVVGLARRFPILFVMDFISSSEWMSLQRRRLYDAFRNDGWPKIPGVG
jgi:hypothetical protein